MGRVDDERLRRLLGGPELAWVLDRVRRRIELGQPLHGTIVRRPATATERDAVARLFGRPPRAASALSVSLSELDELLRRSRAHIDGLAAAVVTLTGPVTNLAEQAVHEGRGWAVAFERIEVTAAGRGELAAWVRHIRGSGLVKRLSGADPETARELLDTLASVIAALPTAGESLSAFAARVTGRAHALDDGSPLGTLALGAARALARLEPPGPDESPAEARREAWAAVGVLCDELSTMVLTLGLPGDSSSATGRVLAAAGASGEPLWLTLRQLVRGPPLWHEVGVGHVFVVENPSVVALAADTLGARSPPIVCTNGQPRAAAMVLLRSLAAAGLRLHHHGDFDWAGLTIGNLLHRRLPTEPWQFDRDAYLRAVAAHPRCAPLTGLPTSASWDPGLGEAMREAGRRVEEELVAAKLLEELA